MSLMDAYKDVPWFQITHGQLDAAIRDYERKEAGMEGVEKEAVVQEPPKFDPAVLESWPRLNLGERCESGHGSYGTYYNLGDGTGVKVMGSADMARAEWAFLQKAEAACAGIYPRPVTLVYVEGSPCGRKYGLRMQHIDGQNVRDMWDQLDGDQFPKAEAEAAMERLCEESRNAGIPCDDRAFYNMLRDKTGRYWFIDANGHDA